MVTLYLFIHCTLFKEKDMNCSSCETKEARKEAFQSAKSGIDPAVVDRVMKGLPVPEDSDPRVRELRRTWARHHQDLRN
jgi:hypothetical protein